MRLDLDLVLRRPLSAGLKELIRLRVLRSVLFAEPSEPSEVEDTERLARFLRPSPPRSIRFPSSMR